MGYAIIGSWSVHQLRRHINSQARLSARVMLLPHARARMKQRGVLADEVHECLQAGSVRGVPEPNPTRGNLEVRMAYYMAGRTVQAVVAVCDEDPRLLIVTVIA